MNIQDLNDFCNALGFPEEIDLSGPARKELVGVRNSRDKATNPAIKAIYDERVKELEGLLKND